MKKWAVVLLPRALLGLNRTGNVVFTINNPYTTTVDSQCCAGIKEIHELVKRVEWIPQNLPITKSGICLLEYALTGSQYATPHKRRRE